MSSPNRWNGCIFDEGDIYIYVFKVFARAVLADVFPSTTRATHPDSYRTTSIEHLRVSSSVTTNYAGSATIVAIGNWEKELKQSRERSSDRLLTTIVNKDSTTKVAEENFVIQLKL
ncbi:uncharacterized protein LOC122534439 [Frieseomelitta varia]|uniref:uncharacterized protein LOC122534439 n=1 Tax=Frieseomelitta varia TaxID=561572 RepID=UPI001CB6AD3B|nr:uncharacterized protein LOC122534439 [Frieseomelitta varia]